MDHHCQVVGTCIYALNTKVYIQLLTVNWVHSFVSLVDLLRKVPQLLQKTCSWYCLGGILFGVCCFWLCYDSMRLLFSQYLTIRDNQTLVETYKKQKGKDQPAWCTFR